MVGAVSWNFAKVRSAMTALAWGNLMCTTCRLARGPVEKRGTSGCLGSSEPAARMYGKDVSEARDGKRFLKRAVVAGGCRPNSHRVTNVTLRVCQGVSSDSCARCAEVLLMIMRCHESSCGDQILRGMGEHREVEALYHNMSSKMRPAVSGRCVLYGFHRTSDLASTNARIAVSRSSRVKEADSWVLILARPLGTTG